MRIRHVIAADVVLQRWIDDASRLPILRTCRVQIDSIAEVVVSDARDANASFTDSQARKLQAATTAALLMIAECTLIPRWYRHPFSIRPFHVRTLLATRSDSTFSALYSMAAACVLLHRAEDPTLAVGIQLLGTTIERFVFVGEPSGFVAFAGDLGALILHWGQRLAAGEEFTGQLLS